MDAKKRWKAAQQFLKDATQEHTHIIHDSDADGIGAGLLMLHALTDLGVPATASTRSDRNDILSEEELQLIKDSYDPERLIFIDISPKNFGAYEHLRRIFPSAQLMVIDHHKINEYDDAVFVHPEQLHGIDGSKYCAAKLTYDLASSVTDVDDYQWLAAVGINGDMNTEYFSDVVIRALEHEDFGVPEDLRQGATDVVNEAIACCEAVGEEALLDYYHQLRECRTLREATLLDNPHKEVLQVVQDYIRNGKQKVDKQGPVNWLHIDSDYSIVGWVGTALSAQYPGELFIMYREKNDGYSMSYRCQNPPIHCGEIADECANEFGGGGGGHAPAAGAWVPQDNFADYQACVREKVESELKKSS